MPKPPLAPPRPSVRAGRVAGLRKARTRKLENGAGDAPKSSLRVPKPPLAPPRPSVRAGRVAGLREARAREPGNDEGKRKVARLHRMAASNAACRAGGEARPLVEARRWEAAARSPAQASPPPPRTSARSAPSRTRARAASPAGGDCLRAGTPGDRPRLSHVPFMVHYAHIGIMQGHGRVTGAHRCAPVSRNRAQSGSGFGGLLAGPRAAFDVVFDSA